MIAKKQLATLPTPLQELPRLSKALGGPLILIKRDDLTGVGMGGNKVRKLEFLLQDALDQDAKTLITVGAAQSNHCRQTAAVAARLGLDCILVLTEDKAHELDGNVLLDHLYGAEIIWAAEEERNRVFMETAESASREGRKPYLIPVGASNPLGAYAYKAAFDEMQRQIGSREITWLVVASGSAGTQAGLCLGAGLQGWHGRILGISVSSDEHDLKENVAFLANEASGLMEASLRLEPLDILVHDGFRGEGYGLPGDPEWEAMELFARLEGIVLDPVYTARAAAGMISLIREDFFRRGETVLFWHTGGQPALFSDRYTKDYQKFTERRLAAMRG